MSIIHIGVDAGGTKTHAILQSGEHLLRSDGPGANLRQLGPQQTAGIIARLLEHTPLMRSAKVDGVRICAAVAGAGTTEAAQALHNALLRQLPRQWQPRVLVVHDGIAALEAAFPGSPGTIIIAGTGSVVLGRRPDSTIVRAGGWGRLLGDEGSGYRLGLAALQELCIAFDRHEITPLLEKVATFWDVETPHRLLSAVYDDRRNPAETAPVILQAAAEGDAQALAIVRRNTAELARLTAELLQRTPDLPPHVGLLGGLIAAPVYREALSSAIQEHLPKIQVTPTQREPVEGALFLARTLSADTL